MRIFTQSTILIGIVASAISSCQKGPTHTRLTVENPSQITLTEKPIVLSRAQVDPKGRWNQNLHPLLLSEKKDTLACQLDDRDGDGKWDELFFLADLPPNQTKRYQLTWTSDLRTFEKRTSVRFGVRHSLEDTVHLALEDTFYPHELPGVNGYQPYQTDGPSWENDKVGFRHYLDGRNSKDVFGKKIPGMSPDDVGINADGVTQDTYHVMADWGRDILSVGTSLGIGGISYLLGGDRLRRLGIIEGDPKGNVDSTRFRIFQEGPIHSIIQFDYHQWKPSDENRVYSLKEQVEIWPGMFGYKNTVTPQNLQGDETLLVGLVNSRTKEPLRIVYESDQWIALTTHDKQTYEKEWWLGLGLVLPKKDYLGYFKAPETGRIATSYLAKLKILPNQPVSYYAMAYWELRDPGLVDREYFENQVKNFVQQMEVTPKLTVSHD